MWLRRLYHGYAKFGYATWLRYIRNSVTPRHSTASLLASLPYQVTHTVTQRHSPSLPASLPRVTYRDPLSPTVTLRVTPRVTLPRHSSRRSHSPASLHRLSTASLLRVTPLSLFASLLASLYYVTPASLPFPCVLHARHFSRHSSHHSRVTPRVTPSSLPRHSLRHSRVIPPRHSSRHSHVTPTSLHRVIPCVTSRITPRLPSTAGTFYMSPSSTHSVMIRRTYF